MNVCEAGHRKHIRTQTSTAQGPFWVWDWDTYSGYRGYCTGQDDVSRTLLLYGKWEEQEGDRMRAILRPGDVFLDFGAHIGWFSIMAANRGAVVHAYEGDAENLDLLRINARLHNVASQVTAHALWVGEGTKTEDLHLPSGPIRLVKIDLEGNEQYAVGALLPALDRIEHIAMEVSPCFNDSYPDIVAVLEAHGFQTWRQGRPFDGCWKFHQDNFEFRRPGA